MNTPVTGHEHHGEHTAATATSEAEAKVVDTAAMMAKFHEMPRTHFVTTELTFRFRTDKELGTKKPPVILAVPFYTMEGIIAAMQDEKVGGKVQELIIDLVNEHVTSAVREQVADETNPVTTESALDLSKLSLQFLATVPKSDRRGAGITKETWEAFTMDYVTVMTPILTQGANPRTAEQVANAAKLFALRFNPVKLQQPVISKLLEYLDLWFMSTTKGEDLQDVYEYLKNRADALLKVDPTAWQSAI
jgi:hypothetical protein